jgi:hypothetical protein
MALGQWLAITPPRPRLVEKVKALFGPNDTTTDKGGEPAKQQAGAVTLKGGS